MPDYAQKTAKRTGGSNGARGLTRPTSHATVSAPAGTDGGPAGPLQALLNEALAAQAVTQMKGALNRRGSSLQVAQSKAAFDDAPVDVAQDRFETVQHEQGVEEAECPPDLTGLDIVHASLNRAPLVERTAQLRRSLNQSPRVVQLGGTGSSVALRPATPSLVIQQRALVRDKLNVAGENHPESEKRRDQEAAYTTEKTGGGYYQEGEFKTSQWFWQPDRLGDPMLLRAEMLLAILREKTVARILTPFAANRVPPALRVNIPVEEAWNVFREPLESQLREIATALVRALDEKAEVKQAVKAQATFEELKKLIEAMPLSVVKDVGPTILPAINGIIARFAKDVLGREDIRSESEVSLLRSKAMQEAAATKTLLKNPSV